MANKLIGQNYTTPDLVAKVTGQAKYAEDYRADGMLFCKLLLSPLPHGRIKRIDSSGARRSRYRSWATNRRKHEGREGVDQRAGVSG
jgi:CO/xanthine dehydrogenase Mo-binding subunit